MASLHFRGTAPGVVPSHGTALMNNHRPGPGRDGSLEPKPTIRGIITARTVRNIFQAPFRSLRRRLRTSLRLQDIPGGMAGRAAADDTAPATRRARSLVEMPRWRPVVPAAGDCLAARFVPVGAPPRWASPRAGKPGTACFALGRKQGQLGVRLGSGITLDTGHLQRAFLRSLTASGLD